jgi:hypothetical protein
MGSRFIGSWFKGSDVQMLGHKPRFQVSGVRIDRSECSAGQILTPET